MSLPTQRARHLRHWLRFPAAILCVVLGAALLAGRAAAQNPKLDLQSFYRTDLRALAMGNAFGPIARGETALQYNPAGLVQYKFDVKLDASLAVEGEAGPFFQDTFDMISGSPSSTDVQNYLAKYLGTSQFYRAQTFANVVANLAAFNVGLGGGVLSQTRYGFTFDDTVVNGTLDPGDTLILDEQSLDITLASFAFQIFEGKLLMGITLKNFTFANKTASDTFGNIIASGNIELTTAGATYAGSGYDLGFIYRLENLFGFSSLAAALRPQASLVANNLGGITLQKPGFTTIEVPASYDVGFAINPELPWSPVHLLIAVQAEDVTGAIPVSEQVSPGVFVDHDRSSTQRLHYGAELGIWATSTGNHILNFRLGQNRGLNSTGFELNLFSGMRLLYTRYQDDFGWDGQKDKHTFQAAQLSLGFAF
jgi:hypothetical protein